jgi:hypothetical protein
MIGNYPTYTDFAPLPIEPSDEWNSKHDVEIEDEQEEFNDYLGGATWQMPSEKKRLTQCSKRKWQSIAQASGSVSHYLSNLSSPSAKITPAQRVKF